MKLKPCPFCGEDDTEVDTLNNHWLFICSSCGARTYGVTGNPTEEQATKDWNHRPFESHAVEVLTKQLCFKNYIIRALRPGQFAIEYEYNSLDQEKARAEARELLGIKEGK